MPNPYDQFDPPTRPVEPPVSGGNPYDQFDPAPIKVPDTSGIQKMAQDNLAAHDNQQTSEDGQPKQPLNPTERLNTSAGFPVDKVVNGQAKPSDFTQMHRTEYVNGLNNGSWVDSSDAMPTWAHSITPIAAGFAKGAYSPFKPIVNDFLESLKDTATQTGEAMSEPYNEKNVPAWLEPADIAVKTLGKAGNAIAGSVGAVFIPEQGALTASAEGLIPSEARAIASLTGQNPNLTPEQIHTLAKGQGSDLTNALMLGLSTPKAAKGLFGDILPPESAGASSGGMPRIGGPTLQDVTPAEGHWDNHPGSEPIIEAVAKQLGKPPSEVTTPEVDHALAQGGRDIFPAGKDFKAVSGVMGIPESSLKNVFQVAGVTPEQVFLANQKDKTVGDQVAKNEVPDQWKHLVPEQPETPETVAPVPASLEPSYHFDTDTFGVKNEKGEFIKTGFGSQEEAHDYIEHREERAAIEEESKAPQPIEPTTEKTEQGDQQVIPGAEKISDKILAERKMDEPLKGGNAPLEGGLFDVAGRGQGDIFDQPVEKTTVPTDQERYLKNLNDGQIINKGVKEILDKSGSDYAKHIEKQGAGVGGTVEVLRAPNLKEIMPKDKTELYHSTSMKNVDGILSKFMKGSSRHDGVFASSEQHLALGQKGNDVTLIIDPKKVNGVVPDSLANHSVNGAEYVIKLSVGKSVKGFIVKNAKALESLKEKMGKSSDKFDFGSPKDDEGGLRVDRIPEHNSTEVATKAKPQGIVAPAEIGKTTSLRSFLSQQSLKAKFNEGHELVSIVKNGETVKGDVALDYAHQLAKEYGYMPQDLPDRPSAYASELADLLHETDGEREATRIQDADRVAKAREADELAKQKDPAYIAEQAHKAGIDTDKLEGESDKKWLKRMNDALKDFQTSIAEPTIEAVQNMWGDESGSVPSNVLQEIRDTIAPTMAGKNAQQAAIVLRNAYGIARRERARDETTLSAVARIAAKMDDAARKDFYRYVEGRSKGEALNDKALQPLADSVRAVYQRMRGQLEAMPETRMMNFVRDYFTHQWEDPEAAAKFTNEFIAAQGSGRSLKKRTLPTIAEGLAAGLELKESNPVRAVSAYLGSMTNYIASVNGLRSIVHDLGAEYAVKGQQQEGYEPLVGRNAERIENARIDPTSGKMIPARNMQLYAPKEVAMIYNRFYSKGFENTGIKSTYELARDAINTNTMFELGLSTYHLGTINIQSINQDVGRMLKNAIVGDWKGVVDATKKLVTPGLHFMQGRELMQQYNGLKDHGINMEAMAEHFAKANLRIGQDPLSVISKKGFVHGAMRGELPEIIDHLKQQAVSGYGTGLVKSGAEVAARVVSDISAPIFQHYVPAIKMSSFSDLMNDWLRQNPKASDAEIAVAQARIGNLVDDRFGEMNMENVFWHKMMKQITGLVFRAPGWDLGLIRQVGGAAKDFYSTLEGAATGKKFNPDLLDRQLYMVAAVGLYAAANSALTYLHTGVPPTEQELLDFIAYRTGGMRKQFNKWLPERGVLPGHGRELVNMYPVPGQGIVSGLTEEIKNKVNTLPKNIWDDITNHDWQQKDIYDPESKSWIQRTPGVAQASHIIGGFKPFAIDSMTENEKDEGTNISPLARSLGVRPAGTRITDREDLEKFLNKKH